MIHIKNKLILWLIIFVIVPISLVVCFYDYTNQTVSRETILSLSIQLSDNVISSVNNRIMELEKNINMSIANNTTSYILANNGEKEKANQEILKAHYNSFIYSTQYIDSIVILPFEGESLVYSRGAKDSPYIDYLTKEENGFKDTMIYEDVVKDKGKYHWINYQDQIFVMKRFVYFPDADPIGVIVWVIDKEYLYPFDQGSNYSNIYVMDKYHNLVKGTSAQGVYLTEEIKTAIQTKETVWIEKDQRLWTYKQLANQWIVVTETDLVTVMQKIYGTRELSILIIIITILVCIFTIRSVAKGVGKNIESITKKFEKVEAGDFDVEVSITSHDELEYIDIKFIEMVKKLRLLIEQNYLYDLKRKEAELQALQYQINPHFLNNTLQAISSMAEVNNCSDISQACVSLGNLFRYNLIGTAEEHAQLQDEIQHVLEYIYLENLKLAKPIQVMCDLGDETKHLNIIKFILQPIVENSIRHGFKNKNNTHCIEIVTYIEGDSLIIDIMDDGGGISTTALEDLNTSLQQINFDGIYRKGKSIGLCNVNYRMKLAYGENYGISVKSEEHRYTLVKVQLPIDSK